MKRALLLVGVVVLTLTASGSASQQNATVAFGKWKSTESFEGEPRITVAFRQGTRSIEGWAVLLGQRRKTDDRATLALSFAEATWNGQTMAFDTILPEDEGTIGWELQVRTPTTAVLTAVTEDGQPLQDKPNWNMTK